MDIEYLLFLQSLRDALPDFVSKFMMFVSDLDLAACYAIPLVLFWCVSKKSGSFVALSAGFGCALNQLLKTTFCVYRPWIRSEKILPYGNSKASAGGYSFPSGHSAVAATIYGGVAQQYWKERTLSLCMILLALLTGFSRNYLGCHTPQDVAAGLCEGAIVVAAIHFLTKWISKNEGRDKWLLLGSVLFALALIFYAELKSYPRDFVDGILIVDGEAMKPEVYGDCARLVGFVLGWFLERRFVRFDISGGWRRKTFRAFVGFAIVALIYGGFSAILSAFGMDRRARRFVVEFCAAFFVMFIGPFAMKRIQKRENQQSTAQSVEF